MNQARDWDPDSYLRFADERTQPSVDLVSRIRLESPTSIIDIGCGPGNSTKALRGRWAASDILGLDSSEAMIAKARSDYPEGRWAVGDAAKFDALGLFDLVFSNATLQWIPNHEELIPRLMAGVAKQGALAVQIPLFGSMPIGVALGEIAASPKWKELTAGCAELFTYHESGFYYELLCGLAAKLELWETSYIHVLESHGALIDFLRSTALKPYLERLPDEEARGLFVNSLLARCRELYPLQRDGRVLFPFQRMFFVAYKA